MTVKLIVDQDTDVTAPYSEAIRLFCDAEGMHPGEKWFELHDAVQNALYAPGGTPNRAFRAGYDYLARQDINVEPTQRLLAEGAFWSALEGKPARISHGLHLSWSRSGVYLLWMVFLGLVFLIGSCIISSIVGNIGKAFHWMVMSNGIYASGSMLIVLLITALGVYLGYGVASRHFRHTQPA